MTTRPEQSRAATGDEEGQGRFEVSDVSCHSMRRQGITMDELTSFQPRLPSSKRPSRGLRSRGAGRVSSLR